MLERGNALLLLLLLLLLLRARAGGEGHSQTALFLRSMPEAPGRTAALPMLASAIFASALPTVLAATTEKTHVTISLLPNMQKVQACRRTGEEARGRSHASEC